MYGNKINMGCLILYDGMKKDIAGQAFSQEEVVGSLELKASL
jgi:hypothetical protein